MIQLALPLSVPDEAEDGGFLISDSNRLAVQQLEHWGSWPVMAVVITGPRKSGKSRLGRIMAARSGGRMIDDADRADESVLFHAWNAAQAERQPLFLAADVVPPEWTPRLPDLRTRLAATPVARIDPPDDALVEALLAYLLERRQLLAKPDLIGWLARRADRDHVALIRIADALEESAMRRSSRRMSIPTARAVLEEAGLVMNMQDQVSRGAS
jgi:chromosomal replication initiation ATPase DnaA